MLNLKCCHNITYLDHIYKLLKILNYHIDPKNKKEKGSACLVNHPVFNIISSADTTAVVEVFILYVSSLTFIMYFLKF